MPPFVIRSKELLLAAAMLLCMGPMVSAIKCYQCMDQTRTTTTPDGKSTTISESLTPCGSNGTMKECSDKTLVWCTSATVRNEFQLTDKKGGKMVQDGVSKSCGNAATLQQYLRMTFTGPGTCQSPPSLAQYGNDTFMANTPAAQFVRDSLVAIGIDPLTAVATKMVVCTCNTDFCNEKVPSSANKTSLELTALAFVLTLVMLMPERMQSIL